MRIRKSAGIFGAYEVTVTEGSQLADSGLMQVIVDKETGVNYLFIKAGYGAGLTPLLDADGKVVITR